MKELVPSLLLAVTSPSLETLPELVEIRDSGELLRGNIILEIRAKFDEGELPISIYDPKNHSEEPLAKTGNDMAPKDKRRQQDPTTQLLEQIFQIPPFLPHAIRQSPKHGHRRPVAALGSKDPPPLPPPPSLQRNKPVLCYNKPKLGSVAQLTTKTQAMLQRTYRHFGKIR